MQPVICMITAPLEAGDSAGADSLVARIRAAARAGVHLVQIRQPHLDARRLYALVEEARAMVDGTPTRVIVNDRVDVALEARAHGVHLRGDSMPATRMRRLARVPMLVGRSIHDREDAQRVAAAADLDYLICGSVFPPRSKPAGTIAGVEALREVCRAVACPVLAIGGMTVDRLREVAGAGAAGFAAISLFADPPPDHLSAVVRDARGAFDTPLSVP